MDWQVVGSRAHHTLTAHLAHRTLRIAPDHSDFIMKGRVCGTSSKFVLVSQGTEAMKKCQRDSKRHMISDSQTGQEVATVDAHALI